MAKNQPFDASDPGQVAAREQKLKDQRLQELEDIKWMLKNKPCVRFFKRLFADGKIFETTFTGNSNGFFLEGQRNLALKYLGDVVEAAPHRVADLLVDREGQTDGDEG